MNYKGFDYKLHHYPKGTNWGSRTVGDERTYYWNLVSDREQKWVGHDGVEFTSHTVIGAPTKKEVVANFKEYID